MIFLNGVRKPRLNAKETLIANCEVLDEKYRRRGVCEEGANLHRLVSDG